MSFNEKLIEYYKDITKFSYKGKPRNDISKIEVLSPRSCNCSYNTIFGKCDGSMIRIYYHDQSPHTTCSVYRGGLKLHPISSSNKRW
jgi:hypothetical protein